MSVNSVTVTVTSVTETGTVTLCYRCLDSHRLASASLQPASLDAGA